MTRRSPPMSRARSFMPCTPSPSPLVSSGRKPRPLSTTLSRSSPSRDLGVDPNHGGVGVLADVRKRFLEDAQHLDLGARRAARRQIRDGQVGAHARSAGEVVNRARR